MTASFTIPQLKSEKPLRWVYEGEWEAGLPHGVGRLESTDSTVYNGPLRRGAPSGFGTLCAGKGAMTQAIYVISRYFFLRDCLWLQHDSTCIQMDFVDGRGVGEGTVVADSKRYALECVQGYADDDDEESECFLLGLRGRRVSEARWAAGERKWPPALRFTDLVELWQTVPHLSLASLTFLSFFLTFLSELLSYFNRCSRQR